MERCITVNQFQHLNYLFTCKAIKIVNSHIHPLLNRGNRLIDSLYILFGKKQR